LQTFGGVTLPDTAVKAESVNSFEGRLDKF